MNNEINLSKKIKVGVGLGVAAVILSTCMSGGVSFQESKNKTLQEFQKLTINQRHEIVGDYAGDKSIPSDTVDDFYACISEMLHTKSKELTLETVSGWCQTDYEQGNLSGHINFDAFEKGFSPWDGSYRALEKSVKNAMNNPDSYEHIKTTYRFVLHGVDEPKAIVSTEFRGKNAFGGVVKDSAMAAVRIKDGTIIEFL
ncbi:hypothetical protein L1D52_23965 [Vibrio brasiliensis]|uniref:hypothetical protein n=1 Tax=Vibrio brasiliensis TaxID=170652 RepID=UPI001EFD6267|nr:hypothetical protein [Vibrio brasiliensis]MCG9785368.1 hypothetical protein [Vibrio brasiliensis]